MFKFKVKHNGKWLDATNLIDDIEWSESTESLGIDFSFKKAYSKEDPYFKRDYFVGDKFLATYDGKEIIRGIITSKPIEGGDYTGHDLAFYLNKSETLIQFRKISATKAIKKLCYMHKVPIGSIPEMKTNIKKIYKDVTVYDVIKDILKQVKNETGKSYRMEMKDGKFIIRQAKYYKIDPKFKALNGNRIRCTSSMDVSGDLTMEEMKTKIIVAGTDEKKKQIKAVVENKKMQSKYGVLTEVLTRDKITNSKARNVAKNKLNRSCKVSKNITLEMPGNPFVKPARLLYINQPKKGFPKGYYAIKSVSHHINNGIHTMTVELR